MGKQKEPLTREEFIDISKSLGQAIVKVIHSTLERLVLNKHFLMNGLV